MSGVIKRALLIGINYTGSQYALSGCINDSVNLKEFLKSKKYFTEEEFIMMNDNQEGVKYPSKLHIIEQLAGLLNLAHRNKSKEVLLLVAYSGHGANVTDTSGDEADGRDEVLCPIDCATQGYITDDVIKEVFISKLPRNVKLVKLIDACHSSTMLDLKYHYLLTKLNTYTVHGKMPMTRCTVISISGCRDDQTSSDAYLENKETNKYEHQGAMTASFIANFEEGITYNKLMKKMREWLKVKGFTQVPELCSGRYINVKERMLLCDYK